MAARSPSRYVAEVKDVSNPNLAYSEDKTPHVTSEIPLRRMQVKPRILKYFSNLRVLTRANFEYYLT